MSDARFEIITDPTPQESTMPRTETAPHTLYTFDELDESAKACAIESNRDWYIDRDWWDVVYDDFKCVCEILGVELATESVRLSGGKNIPKPMIYFSGFWSQGDGASFFGRYAYAKGAARKIREYAPSDIILHGIADGLQSLQAPAFYSLTATIERGRYGGGYCHENTMVVDVESTMADSVAVATVDCVVELIRALARWLYRTLEREYEYLTSDETITESFIENRVKFDACGKLA